MSLLGKKSTPAHRRDSSRPVKDPVPKDAPPPPPQPEAGKEFKSSKDKSDPHKNDKDKDSKIVKVRMIPLGWLP